MTKDGLSGAGPGRLASCLVVRGIGPAFRSPILHSWDSTPEAALQAGGYRWVETAEAKCLTGTSTVFLACGGNWIVSQRPMPKR